MLVVPQGCARSSSDRSVETRGQDATNARPTVPVAQPTHTHEDAASDTRTALEDAAAVVADAAPKVGKLEGTLSAKGDAASDPSIETQMWCGFDEHDVASYSKHMSSTARFSNLPAISDDGQTLAFIVEDGPEGLLSHGASLRIDSRAGVVLRTLRLWSFEDDDRTPSSDPMGCSKAKARVEKAFAAVETDLRRHTWRKLERLPKSWKVIEKQEPTSVCGVMCKLDGVTVKDPAGVVVLNTDPSSWLATHTPKGTCAAAVPSVASWLDATSKLLVLGLHGACHSDTGPVPSGLVLLMQPY